MKSTPPHKSGQHSRGRKRKHVVQQSLPVFYVPTETSSLDWALRLPPAFEGNRTLHHFLRHLVISLLIAMLAWLVAWAWTRSPPSLAHLMAILLALFVLDRILPFADVESEQWELRLPLMLMASIAIWTVPLLDSQASWMSRLIAWAIVQLNDFWVLGVAVLAVLEWFRVDNFPLPYAGDSTPAPEIRPAVSSRGAAPSGNQLPVMPAPRVAAAAATAAGLGAFAGIEIEPSPVFDDDNSPERILGFDGLTQINDCGGVDSSMDHTSAINPATGLPMVGAVDVGGNFYGTTSNDSMHAHTIDHWGSSDLSSSIHFCPDIDTSVTFHICSDPDFSSAPDFGHIDDSSSSFDHGCGL